MVHPCYSASAGEGRCKRCGQVASLAASVALLYPGDRAFEYVVDQANKPIVWPSKEYFQK